MAEGAPQDDLDRLVVELIRYMRLTHRAKAMMSSTDAGADQSAMLLLPPLVHLGPMRITALAELKAADPSTVSRQAAQLVKAGLARKEPDPDDGRAARLAATESGHAACKRLTERRRAMISAALHEWPAEQLATFAVLFRQFNSSVEDLMRSSPDALAPADVRIDATPRENE
jgi:DNA-binding MarR family transcriptional regulator